MNLYVEEIPGGGMWSMRVPTARLISIRALSADANVSALFYRADQPLDRLNVPDTLKALHTARITKGHVLMSDMGHALASVVEDSVGWHDPLGGHSSAEDVERIFGRLSYAAAGNEFYRNARDVFLVELGKHGLGLSDLVANLNFFSKVVVDQSGQMRWVPGNVRNGSTVTLRSEVDLLIVLANCPHPMHPGGAYPRVPVEIVIEPCAAPGPDDFCRNFRPECGRAMELSERLRL